MSIFQWFFKSKSAKVAAPALSAGQPSDRKYERLEQREFLYAVVRECMKVAGVLPGNYKFKVLSLDSRGRKYMMMMDLTRLFPQEATKLTEIERLIAQTAQARHEIVVSAVYWRVNEYVGGEAAQNDAPQSKVAANEPQKTDEMTSLNMVLAAIPQNQPLSSPGEIIRPERRKASPQPGFEDTEHDDRHAPLSGTQYGDLN